MALVRWDSTPEVDSLQTEVNRVFDVFFGNGAGSGQGARARRWVPAMDLIETEDNLVLRADLPGVAEEDVSIEIKDGVLVVSGERRAEHEDKAEGFYRVERSFGAFSRSLSLPPGIDAERVAAEFADGVLEVRIPKPAERRPHRVSIGGSSNSAAGASVEGTAEERYGRGGS